MQKKKSTPKMKAARKVRPPECGVCGAVGGTQGHAVDALGNVHHPWPAPAVEVKPSVPIYPRTYGLTRPVEASSAFPPTPAPKPEPELPITRMEVCPKCGMMSFTPNIRKDGVLGKCCCFCSHWWPNTQAPVYNEQHYDFKERK